MRDPRIIAQSSDPRFAQQNPRMVRIRTLRITYIKLLYIIIVYIIIMHVIFFLLDLTDQSSFERAKFWVNELKQTEEVK